MMGIIEQSLCARLMDILQGILPDVTVEGKWLPESNGVVKGADRANLKTVIDVTVKPRSYDGYTSRIAEFRVSLDGRTSAALDRDAQIALGVYGIVTDGLLESWQRDINAVKDSLSLDGFDPVGFRMDGGEWNVDADDAREFSQSFTVKGRLTKERTDS